MSGDKHAWLDRPENVKRLWRGFLAALVVLVLAELGLTSHPHFSIDAIYGFYAWYGFLACAVLIGVAKALGYLLKRPDSYYERSHD